MKPSWRLTTTQKCDIVRRYLAGEKLEAIAFHFAIRNQTVGTLARRLGLPLRRPGVSLALKARAAVAAARAECL